MAADGKEDPSAADTVPVNGKAEGSKSLAGADLRDRLIHQFEEGTYECAICCDVISRKEEIWTCDSCYHSLHLSCLQQWGMAKLQPNGGFACPAGCRQPYTEGVFQLQYKCWCRKVKIPEDNLYCLPHSCGGPCGKLRADTLCPHPCPLQCHPGPCPPCPLTACRPCHCGKLTHHEECAAPKSGWSCNEPCGKVLSCDKHTCTLPCHPGECSPCEVQQETSCWCSRHSQVMVCTKDAAAGWSCGEICGVQLDCGCHTCPSPCHPADVEHICYRSPKVVKACACGKSPLWKLHMVNPKLTVRKSCLDPIPVCGGVCGKTLACGVESHTCGNSCHEGPCDDCLMLQTIYCRCGNKSTKVPCVLLYKDKADIDQEILKLDLDALTARQAKPKAKPVEGGAVPEGRRLVGKSGKSDIVFKVQVGKKAPPVNVWIDLPFMCQRKCKEPLTCRRHKCEQTCCPFSLTLDEHERALIHQCPQKCNRRLSCRNHKCEDPCHDGPCSPCLEISLEEIRCRCSRTVIEPPIPCGDNRIPRCTFPCSIPRECGHPSNHECHLDGKCPPCVVMVQKMCLGKHVDMPFQTACHHPAVSCGAPCGQILPCGAHLCTRNCHDGTCSTTATPDTCGEPCWKEMPCGHVCSEQCHGLSPCPMEKCQVKFKCPCLCGETHSVSCLQHFQALIEAKREYALAQQQWALTIRELRQLQLPIPPPPSILTRPMTVVVAQPCCVASTA